MGCNQVPLVRIAYLDRKRPGGHIGTAERIGREIEFKRLRIFGNLVGDSAFELAASRYIPIGSAGSIGHDRFVVLLSTTIFQSKVEDAGEGLRLARVIRH